MHLGERGRKDGCQTLRACPVRLEAVARGRGQGGRRVSLGSGDPRSGLRPRSGQTLGRGADTENGPACRWPFPWVFQILPGTPVGLRQSEAAAECLTGSQWVASALCLPTAPLLISGPLESAAAACPDLAGVRATTSEGPRHPLTAMLRTPPRRAAPSARPRLHGSPWGAPGPRPLSAPPAAHRRTPAGPSLGSCRAGCPRCTRRSLRLPVESSGFQG